jgi:hypothetical protein
MWKPRAYLCFSVNNRDVALDVRALLAGIGVGCVATWLDAKLFPRFQAKFGPAWEAYARKWEARDLLDLRSADFVILDGTGPPSTGRYTEFGYALALLDADIFHDDESEMRGAPRRIQNFPIVYVVGPAECPFAFHPGVRRVPNWSTLIDRVRQDVEHYDALVRSQPEAQQ